jgi:hypothetical protein
MGDFMLKSKYLLLLSAFFIANSAFSTLAYAELCCPENNTDPYIRVAEKDGNQCSIRECIAGYIEKGGSCNEIKLGETLDGSCNDHATTCIYDRDFFAKITECESGYQPDMFGLTCIKPDYTDDSCVPKDEFALSGVMVDGECQSDWCKRGHLKDTNNNKCIPNKCDDGFAYVDTYGCLEISKCGVIEGNTKIFYTSEEDLKISCETNITSPIKSNENALADGCDWEITLDENIVINDIMVKIIDETSKSVITDAIVTTNGILIATEEGRFSLKEIQDNTEIKISRSGYETKTITAEAIRNLPEENPSTKMRIIYLTEQTKQDNDTPADGTDCTTEKNNPAVKHAEYKSGKCVATACNDGYDLKDGNCADINGSPCDNLPANATAGKREYNAATKETTCIVTACDKYYIVSENKKSCEKDPEQEIQELKDKAQAAKDKEQSTENKLLGAVGIGATGIGGMQLASALAEQSADANALTDMTAYLETFKCTYGNNASVSGGTTNIETPGGNSLLSLYTEYVSLANDLKLRKNMLEMPAGIESEAILSSANGNLYNNDTTDKTSGAYASLARALSDPTGADAQKLAQQQTDTADKLKTGAIVAGVGAVGGLVGDLAINAKAPKERSDEINTKYTSLKTELKKDQEETDE